MNSLRVGLALVALAPMTIATETSCRTFTVPAAFTNWQQVLEIPRFDPATGFLIEVRITLTGTAFVGTMIECLDTAPSVIDITRSGSAFLEQPGGGAIVTVSPTFLESFPFGAYDGTTDFMGASGLTLPPVTITSSALLVAPYPASSSAALFVGPPTNPGILYSPFRAIGTSNASGAGNLITVFNTMFSGTVEVCYVFDPDCNANAVPDSQDISTGTSLDANGNGVPDECDYSITQALCVGDGSGNACPCGNTSTPGGGAGCANSTGSGGVLGATGVARISSDTLLLAASGMPATTTALFFQGTTSLNSDLGSPFGDGLRCAGGTIRRLGARVAQGGAAGFPATGGPGIATVGGVTPGVRVYQSWYRNALSFCTPSTFNLTSGVRVVWGI